MTLEENKAVIRNWIDARNSHDLEKALAFWSEEWQVNIRNAFNSFTQLSPTYQSP
jgi:hypothetical protein